MSQDFRVEFTARSREDVQAARHWLTQPGSGRRSHRRYLALLHALSDLGGSPHRWPASDHVGFRKRSIEGYLVIYSIDAGRRTITVRRIFGPGQETSTL
ncbi:type II toxin-antitoxin system RelE/ParE family toxin [Brevundimonas sp. R86498]|uniref:type II toxin-antitoxin system RelE/ParE family toxin n=1 Tax=Brevundimonas sp. R86498 TaxID=3093845 RepID=UPI0037C502AA